MIECPNCYQGLLDESQLIKLADQNMAVCSDCAARCDICGDFYLADDLTEFDGKNYCESCLDENTAECYYCSERFGYDDLIDVNGTLYCENCSNELFVTCYDCGNFVPRENAIVYYTDFLCERCYERYYGYCNNCEDIFNQNDLIYDEHSSCYYCEDCFDSLGINCLASYNYKPKPVFYKLPSETTNLFFGIELEIECEGNDRQSAIENLPDFVFAKEDGSLDDGMEIVTHPCSWNWLQGNKSKFEPIFELSKRGFRSYDTTTCGIHIHLSKKAFGTLHLLKFLRFFYENPAFILLISQRRESKFNEWCTIDGDDENITYKAKIKGNKKRYTAVNLQNYDTVEIRIFRGTLNPQGFWKDLEFAKAVYDYTFNVSLRDVNVTEFCKFVVENKKEYKHLENFLREKNQCV